MHKKLVFFALLSCIVAKQIDLMQKDDTDNDLDTLIVTLPVNLFCANLPRDSSINMYSKIRSWGCVLLYIQRDCKGFPAYEMLNGQHQEINNLGSFRSCPYTFGNMSFDVTKDGKVDRYTISTDECYRTQLNTPFTVTLIDVTCLLAYPTGNCDPHSSILIEGSREILEKYSKGTDWSFRSCRGDTLKDKAEITIQKGKDSEESSIIYSTKPSASCNLIPQEDISQDTKISVEKCIMLYESNKCLDTSDIKSIKVTPGITIDVKDYLDTSKPFSFRPCSINEENDDVEIEFKGESTYYIPAKQACKCQKLDVWTEDDEKVEKPFVVNHGTCIILHDDDSCKEKRNRVSGGVSSNSLNIKAEHDITGNALKTFTTLPKSFELCYVHPSCAKIDLEILKLEMVPPKPGETAMQSENDGYNIHNFVNDLTRSTEKQFMATKSLLESSKIELIKGVTKISPTLTEDSIKGDDVTASIDLGLLYSICQVYKNLSGVSSLHYGTHSYIVSEDKEYQASETLIIPACTEVNVKSISENNHDVKRKYLANVKMYATYNSDGEKVVAEKLKGRIPSGLQFESEEGEHILNLKGKGSIEKTRVLHGVIKTVASVIPSCCVKMTEEQEAGGSGQ